MCSVASILCFGCWRLWAGDGKRRTRQINEFSVSSTSTQAGGHPDIKTLDLDE